MTRSTPVTVQKIERVFDAEDLSEKAAIEVPRHGVGVTYSGIQGIAERQTSERS